MAAGFKMQLSYLDADTTQVRVVESSAGEPRHTTSPPFDPVTLRALLQVLEKGSLDKCRLDDEELDALHTFGLIRDTSLLGPQARNRIIGQQLYKALFPVHEDPNRNVRGALDAAITLAKDRDAAIPFQLRFDSDAVGLASVPWELICDPNGQHPVADGNLRFTRYITFGQAVATFPVADRLDVLVITARPVDTQSLDPQGERQAIESAFAGLQRELRVHVQHLDPPTRDGLVAELDARPYHIVHFDGHGGFARRCPVCEEYQAADLAHCMNPACPDQGRLGDAELEGCLAFERSRTDHIKHLVGARDLGVVLTGRRVRLFVASACQSGTVGGLSVFSGIGPGLILAGVPSVVAMQFSVPADAAVDFASAFYAALARGKPIAAAAAAGRRLLFDRGLWYTPTVYLRSRDGEGYLFRHRAWHYLLPKGESAVNWSALRPADAAPYKFLSPYEITDHVVFHGRDADTQQVLGEVLHRRVAVLHGPPSVGKTSLVNAGLTPALIDRGCLVLTVREYGDPGDPMAMLRQEVISSPVLEVELRHARTLIDVIGALQQDVGRPMVIVFDEFDSFLWSATPRRRQAFAQQIAQYAETDYLLGCCVLLVVRGDALSELYAALPDIPHARIFLAPLDQRQAQEAIEEPLLQKDPVIHYDEVFLQETLLRDLRVEAGGEDINPAHLQIVCHELYRAAQQRETLTINGDLYPEEGAQKILADYLAERLGRLGPDRQDVARAILKQMVSGSGERVFAAPARIANSVGFELTDVQPVIDALLRDGLLETRVTEAGEITCSLSHHLLAAEIHNWFDREEAMNRCAQQSLDRAWDDWYGQTHAPAGDEAEQAKGAQPLLVAPDRLREIRGRRPAVEIGGPQMCLLLRSAVHHRCDMAYWAGELESHADARKLLQQVHTGQAVEPAGPADGRQAILCAEALGLEPDALGASALARAAVGHHDGNVRHSAALALGALWGALTVESARETEQTLVDAAPVGQRWRRVQALAQIKAAGFALPRLSGSLQVRVNAWLAGIRLYEARWPLASQAVGAGLGGGFSLMLVIALVTLITALSPVDVGYDLKTLSGAILVVLPIGGLMSALFAVARWLLGMTPLGRVGRVLGGGLGFCLGVLAWILYVTEPRIWLPLGGLLAGVAIALGWELAVGPSETSKPWRAGLGAGAGGALAFAVTVDTSAHIPGLLGSQSPIFSDIQGPWLSVLVRVIAVLTGAAMGAGMAMGATAGELLWNRLRAHGEA